jgi:NTP pyrophosphatase (non-canonical NTP hydrolase)
LNSDIFQELKSEALQFSKKRNWTRYHNPKNLSMAIAVEAAELMEILQWWTIEESRDKSSKKLIKKKIEGEVADILIYILHLANSLDINLENAVKTKLKLNEGRFTDKVVSDLERNGFSK